MIRAYLEVTSNACEESTYVALIAHELDELYELDHHEGDLPTHTEAEHEAFCKVVEAWQRAELRKILALI